MPNISVLIVTYNSARDIEACLLSVKEKLSADLQEIIVVDNASTDETVQKIQTNFSDVHLIQNSENVGFAKAMNQAARSASSEFLLFVNPDAVLTSWNKDIVQKFSENIGVVGGVMQSPKGKVRASAGFTPTWKTEMIHAFRGHKIFPIGRYIARPSFYASSKLVDWVSGGLMLIPRLSFMNMGGFDERYFLYMEDIDFCERMRRAGLGIFLDLRLQAIHKEMGSAKSYAQIKPLYFASLRAYFQKWGLWNWRSRCAMKLLEWLSV